MWRIQFVHSGLLGAGIESKLYSAWELRPTNDECWHPVEDWADFIVFERLAIGHWMGFVKRWQDRGIKVFLTFDDAYHIIPNYFKTPSKIWTDPENTKEFTQNLKVFDGVFVPSPGLAAEVSKFGAKVHCVKNYPDLNHPAIQLALRSAILRRDDRYVIGWGGSHHHSMPAVLPALEELVGEWPEIQVWIVGNAAAFNILENIPLENKRFFPRMPYTNYLATIKQFDVFAIPLVGKYDRCRSWIKPLEAALMGVPWVATDDRIYKECQGGRLVKGKEQWKEALMSPEVAAQEWAMAQGISEHIQEYVDVLLGSDTYLWRGRRRTNRRRTKKRKN